MLYSRHRLAASMAYVTTVTYASTNSQWPCNALLAHWSVRQKLNRISSVQLRRSVRALSQNSQHSKWVTGIHENNVKKLIVPIAHIQLLTYLQTLY